MRSTRTRRAPRSTSTGSWRSASPPRRKRGDTPVTAVIAAAGSGERLGAGGPKAFVDLAGRPMIEWSIDAFAACSSVAAIVVAVPPGMDEAFAGRAEVTVLAGGATRAESVANGLEAAGTELVAVHDAARPLLTVRLVEALVSALEAEPEAAGVIAAAPLTDTVKRAPVGRGPLAGAEHPRLVVEATLDREELWGAQTPQVFRTAALREALAVHPEVRDAATDEAMLVEQAGGTVLIHPWGEENLKVTRPQDLWLVEHLLRERAEQAASFAEN